MNDCSSIAISGVGRSIGENLIENHVIEELVGLESGFIERKTGIHQRYYADVSRLISSYCCEAVSEALDTANIEFVDVDCLICVTFSGDDVYPSLALKIASKFRPSTNVFAFDLKANCTGFQSALMVADGLFKTNSHYRHILIVGNGIQSRFIDKSSMASIYFGDACSAVILSSVEPSCVKGEFLAHRVETDTGAYDSVRLRGLDGSGVIRVPGDFGSDAYELSGLEVWKQAVRLVPKAVSNCFIEANILPNHVDCFIWHQANLNLIEYLMGKLKVPLDRAVINVGKFGNTADASIGLALYDAFKLGRLIPGRIICIAGIGAGFMAGASLLRLGKIDA